MITKNVSLVSLIVLEKFSLKSWNLTRNVWLTNILPPSNFALQRAENYSDCLRYGKTGNKKHSTCFAPLLQNELHIKPVLHQIKLLTGLNVVKRAKSLCNSFAAMVQNKLYVFCCLFFRSFQYSQSLQRQPQNRPFFTDCFSVKFAPKTPTKLPRNWLIFPWICP